MNQLVDPHAERIGCLPQQRIELDHSLAAPPVFFCDEHTETPTEGTVHPTRVNANYEQDVSRLMQLKHEIDKKPYCDWWEQYKRYISPYERVHLTRNYKKHSDNIARVVPLSRSYFKMIELLHDFSLVDCTSVQPLRTAHLAEGPGGFIQAVCHKRGKRGNLDTMFGISLKSSIAVPGWKPAIAFLKQYTRVRLHYGKDGTGNLYNITNIDAFVAHVGQSSCQLITADGGFDFSTDFGNQEETCAKLLLCEIYCSLRLVAVGGAIVCKFFDMQLPITQQLVQCLAHTFHTVTITKPSCSRLANSERYVVAEKYHGLHGVEIMERLRNVLLNTDTISASTYIFSQSLSSPFSDVEHAIRLYNIKHLQLQINAIRRCLTLIDSRLSNDQLPSQVATSILNEQIAHSIAWCKKYDVELNMKCKKCITYKFK
jgi:23S rRNA U2552 (ribose-2'-O)-methylase RlmE/FtsJ